jgi:hypothetical protein
MRDYKKLIVWERSHKFAIEIYKITHVMQKWYLRQLILKLHNSTVYGGDKRQQKKEKGFSPTLCLIET